jgi:HK97 family phage prohead protease
MKMNEKMTVPLELKELTEAGEFIGIASPYGNKDLGNDIVERGAFTKTIAERGKKVRLMDSHTTRVGIAEVSETASALEAKGKLNLDKQAGRDVHSDLKFYQAQGLPMGLSIGYKTVKADMDDKGIRHLKEVMLFEVSVTEIPMNEEALITSVKDTNGFLETAILSAREEIKAGRRISAETRRKLEAAKAEIEALLAEEAAIGTPPEEAASKETEPEELHSAAKALIEEIKAIIPKDKENSK